jgi:exportin-T
MRRWRLSTGAYARSAHTSVRPGVLFYCRASHAFPRQGWIDISLTVTQQTIELLFSLLSDASLPIRLATSVALLRILSKGLKEPGDKLQLIKVLSLGQVISELEKKTKAEQAARGSNTDEGEESYREALGRLLNVLGLELIKLDEVDNMHTLRMLD